MSDDGEIRVAVAVHTARTPVLLRLLARPLADDGGLAALSDDAGDLDARGRVMSNLITKYLKLDTLAGTLQSVLAKTSDPDQRDDLSLQIAETVAEESLCKSRYDSIDLNQDFTDPGPGAEAALLTAIQAVDQATQNTDAVKALLTAAHGLVSAYAASSTK